VIGALGNGDTVSRRECQETGTQTWCKIFVPGDMSFEGWVNNHYLGK
jgi:hypothetical protein